MVEDLAYYKGYTDGLEESINRLKDVLENGQTIDDVLKHYNEMAMDYYVSFQKLHELKEIHSN